MFLIREIQHKNCHTSLTHCNEHLPVNLSGQKGTLCDSPYTAVFTVRCFVYLFEGVRFLFYFLLWGRVQQLNADMKGQENE